MEEPNGETLFFNFLPAGVARSGPASLAEISGEQMRPAAHFQSYVTTTIEDAWSLPLTRLTCEHVRLLASQRCGLRWLSRPIAEFVHRYPRAEITFYPGDLTMAALQAFAEIASFDQKAAMLIRCADFSWMAEEYSFSRSLAREAEMLVEAARRE